MTKYLKKFENHSLYTAFTQTADFVKPNVSLCEQENEVHYNPSVDYLICTYSVTADSKSVKIYNMNNPPYEFDIIPIGVEMFNSIEIDGTLVDISELDSNNGKYTLQNGEHTVLFELKDPTILPDAAFYQCTDLSSMQLPKKLKSIGRYAVYNNQNCLIESIPSNVESIGYYAFFGTGRNVITPDEYGVVYIGSYLNFVTDRTKTYYEVKQGTKWIGAQAFDDIQNETNNAEIIVPFGVEIIDPYAFSTTSNETTHKTTSIQMTLPNTVKELRHSAFSNYSGENAELTLNEGIKFIGWSCFDQADLTELTIPSTIETIENNAFERMYYLNVLTILATTPPQCGENLLRNSKSTCIIKVPSQSVDAYKAAEGWSTYANQIQAI